MSTVVADRTLLTFAEVAQRLRVSERTVYRLIHDGAGLPALRIGSQIL
jgi:excisionase family DNA binding protein